MNKKIWVTCVVLTLAACENPVKRAVREVSYSGYQLIGVEKRDLLKRDIAHARDEQKDASETFEDSLDKLRTLYGMPESKLSGQYKVVQSAFAKSDAKAREVRASREKMQTVAHDLFREWQNEVSEIKTADLRSRSAAKLKASRAKFAELDRGLAANERKMEPVLTHLKDHVLFLKHNLNAESLGELKNERDRIQKDVGTLIKDMRATIAQSDEFIKTLR